MPKSTMARLFIDSKVFMRLVLKVEGCISVHTGQIDTYSLVIYINQRKKIEKLSKLNHRTRNFKKKKEKSNIKISK